MSNVMLPTTILRGDRRETERRAHTLLHQVGLEESENKYPDQLSGGMQQRVAIVRSLAHQPRILFMDEPFGALDALTRESLNDLLQEIHQVEGVTTLFVTHNIAEAVFLSDRVLVLSKGGGRIEADIEVSLPRPRTPETLLSPEAVSVEATVRKSLVSASEGHTRNG